MRKVLIIAYHFPPAGGRGAAGSLRTSKFAKHLPAFGWEPVVVSLRPSKYPPYLTKDSTLLEQVAEGLEIVRVGVIEPLAPIMRLKHSLAARLRNQSTEKCDPVHESPETSSGNPEHIDPNVIDISRYQKLKDAITDLFEIPDATNGWVIPALFMGTRAIRRKRVDIIYATGPPWTTLLIGLMLKKITRKPLVVDFRDPWMTSPFRRVCSVLKNSAEKKLEQWVVRSANLILVNNEVLLSEFVDRFGEKENRKILCIPNGYDADEMSAATTRSGVPKISTKFVVVHSGFLYGKRDPRPLIEAVQLLIGRGQVDSGRFSCILFGPRELPYDISQYLESRGLSRVVQLEETVSYIDSLDILSSCHLAVLLQPGTATQVPSKLYEYIGLGKRVLAIAPQDGAVAHIVKTNKLGDVVDPEDVSGIADAIAHAYREWDRKSEVSLLGSSVREKFDVRVSVETLGSEMLELVDLDSLR